MLGHLLTQVGSLHQYKCLVMDTDDLTTNVPTSCNFSRNIGVHIWRITYFSYQPIGVQIYWLNRSPILHISFEHNNIACDDVIVMIIVLTLWYIITSGDSCVRLPKHLFFWPHGSCITIEIVHEDQLWKLFRRKTKWKRSSKMVSWPARSATWNKT